LHDKNSFLRCKVSLKNLIYHLKVTEKQGNTRKRSHIDTPKYKKQENKAMIAFYLLPDESDV